jgi:tetratricopeptide (TPR) repeat protein
MIVKIPFALYCIHTSKPGQRILNIFILLAAGFTLFLANSRASYLSLLLITALYMIYCFLEYRKEKKAEQFLYRIGYVLLPLVAAFFISQIELTTVKNLQDDTLVQKKAVEDVGTVTERLQGITNIADESNRVRLRLWMHAADYTKKHPLIGCGYGNWKIASIPYQRTITEELYVPVHAHNDFIEAFAELGIPGGLLYLAMFFCILVFTVRTYLSDADPETKYMSVFSLLAFTGYSVDAFFNFPGERPISQMFFALITAVNISAYNQSRAEAADPADKPAGGMTLIPLYGFLSIFFLMPAAYVTYLTHKSLVVQKYLIPDMGNEPMKLKWQELFPKIPPIPNISASAQPMDAIKGRYLFEAGKYEEAIILMDKGYKANPLIGYSEFLKAGVYYRMGKMDSAQRNAIKAFYTRPKASTYLQTLMAVLAKTKDTVEIHKAFKEWDRYRHSAFGWNLYLLALVNAIGKGTPELLTLADTAIHQFPKDTILPLRRAEIVQFMGGGSAGVQSAAAAAADLAKAQTLYNAGVAAFTKAKQGAPPANKEDYIEAARNFLKAAAITPNNYIIYENAAIAYFNMGDYPRALVYLDKVINMKTAVTGKSEYFKGVALYNQGKREEGCNWLKIARTKGYAEADGIIKSSCK